MNLSSNKSNKLSALQYIFALVITIGCVYFYASAGVLNPSPAVPTDTQKTLADIYCRLAFCNATAYGVDSPSTSTETMYNLDDIYYSLPAYNEQRLMVYDDGRCSNNNGEANSACAANTAEYTGEESAWTLQTDANLNGALVASGKVYKDSRTKLYWADSYDVNSGANTPDTLTNIFVIGTGCTDADKTNGTCLQDNYQTKGNAIQYCLNLSLDSNGDGADETDWYLPSQKEMLQAYIDGITNNVPYVNTGLYWASTFSVTISSNTYGWSMRMPNGFMNQDNVVNSRYVRCVRRD